MFEAILWFAPLVGLIVGFFIVMHIWYTLETKYYEKFAKEKELNILRYARTDHKHILRVFFTHKYKGKIRTSSKKLTVHQITTLSYKTTIIHDNEQMIRFGNMSEEDRIERIYIVISRDLKGIQSKVKSATRKEIADEAWEKLPK